ncbi:hypothetical protein RSO01_68200 [Reyranella soli]|uniref:Uncharacterized protein n=2 Tax=Reyranella soli TaxID=1230389 RepID=A0A512NL44_9HYPH|nr:hypothetical protein RSO01_68200 [Reyranella soli]
MVTALIRKANLSLPELKSNPARWKDVADAGLLEVDIQCDRYLAALFTFEREQRAGRQILTAAGAGTAAFLGLTGAAGATVAIVAAAFGLAANVFDAGAGSVLFTVSPAAVRAVAVRGRQAFLAGIDRKQITSRPLMMIAVQGYLAQCTPAAIEANIDNAATGAPSVSNIDTALKAAALAAPSASILQNPTIFITAPVAGPAKPADVKTPDKPGNVTAAESEFIRTKADARRVQTALGTTADGDLGPAGATPPGETRLAISEYNTGLLRRDKATGVGRDVMDGKEAIYTNLAASGALATGGFKSPFERALMGNRLDCVSVRPAIRSVHGPVPSPDASDEECVKILREAIVKRRGDPSMPKPMGPADALDSALFDKGPPSRFQ